MTEEAKTSDFAFDKLVNNPRIEADIEGRYNLSDMNNLQSIGYDKLAGKSSDNALDKLLQDYFL